MIFVSKPSIGIVEGIFYSLLINDRPIVEIVGVAIDLVCDEVMVSVESGVSVGSAHIEVPGDFGILRYIIDGGTVCAVIDTQLLEYGSSDVVVIYGGAVIGERFTVIYARILHKQ